MVHEPAKMARPWQRTLSRVGWLLLIWACSVAGLGMAALVMRMFMSVVGMAS